jgi:uncharacterized protein (TIGR02996 family)
MNQIELLLDALRDDPGDHTAWLALADALEEDGQTERAELTRLTCRLRGLPFGQGATEQQRVVELLQGGVRPCVPEVVNSLGMRFARIPTGRFLMGSSESEPDRSDNEGPAHEVQISRPFYLGVHPVTQEQYKTVMGKNPAWCSANGGGKDKVTGLDTRSFPVEQVSWKDAQTFLKKLAARQEEKEKGLKYRLPSEAEWEYACRGGLPSQIFHFGDSLSSAQANFNGAYPYGGAANGPYLERTCSVGSYPPNAFGLFDMHGNVWEWCSDWYDADYYGKSPKEDPPGPAKGSWRAGGSSRVIRGGSWNGLGGYCRSAFRNWSAPGVRGNYVGFRLAAVPAE